MFLRRLVSGLHMCVRVIPGAVSEMFLTVATDLRVEEGGGFFFIFRKH